MSRKSKFNYEPCKEKMNELKFELCVAIDREINNMRMSQVRIACHLGTSQANISRVGNKKVDQLTFNQLFRYLVILKPDIRMLLSSY